MHNKTIAELAAALQQGDVSSVELTQYFIDRMEEEIERNTGVLSEAALEEYREALGRFQSIAERAR